MPLNDEQIKEICEILDREFPLMSSHRFRFMRASDIVRIFNNEMQNCKQLCEQVEKYRAWKANDYKAKFDPWNEDYDSLYGY